MAQLIGSDEASIMLLDKPYIRPARAEYPQGPRPTSTSRDRSMTELVRLTEQLGLYEDES